MIQAIAHISLPSVLGSISHSGLNSMLRWRVPYIPPARQERVTSTTNTLTGILTSSWASRRKAGDQMLGWVDWPVLV